MNSREENAMYKRYIGNTGKYITVEDAAETSHVPPEADGSRSAAPHIGMQSGPAADLRKSQTAGIDTGDMLLLMVLLLLYLDSGDEDFLIILVTMSFAVFG